MTTPPELLRPLTPEQVAAADEIAEFAVRHADDLAELGRAAREQGRAAS